MLDVRKWINFEKKKHITGKVKTLIKLFPSGKTMTNDKLVTEITFHRKLEEINVDSKIINTIYSRV